MSEEEWGPWIEHDGKGCPCVGEYVHIHWVDNGIEPVSEAATAYGARITWDHQYLSLIADKVFAYRIRKPRAIQELKERIATLPEEVDA